MQKLRKQPRRAHTEAPTLAPAARRACCARLPVLLALCLALFLALRLLLELRVLLSPELLSSLQSAGGRERLSGLLRSAAPPEDEGAARAAALAGEAFHLVAVARTDADMRSAERLCVGPACAGQQFLLVDQQRASSDNVLAFLLRSELRVVELFVTLLASADCRGLIGGGGAPWCAHQLPAPRPPPLVVDLGSNSGFYSMLAAASGALVTAIDPQPHCLQYVRVAAAANGWARRVRALNAFAGAAAAPPPPRAVRVRSGCWGMFPHDKSLYAQPGEEPHPATREEYDAIRGGNASASVPTVYLPALLRALAAEARAAGAGDEGVLLLKMDAEGSEVALVAELAASGVLAEHVVKSFVIELNKYALTSEGPPCIDAAAEAPMGAAPCYATMLQHFLDAGYQIMVHEPWNSALITDPAEFARTLWRAVDVWVTVPRAP